MSECKPCQLVECVPANDYTYSLALPPPPAQPPPPFGNDELSYCCPSGTITVTGPIPAYISVNADTNCVSVVPNTFRGADKAVVNGLAQNALNEFVGSQVTCGTTPTVFYNVAQNVFLTCSDLTPGQEGPSECVLVDPGVFVSSISQDDADQHAIDAGNAVLANSFPGPCCDAPTMIQDFTWTLTPLDGSGTVLTVSWDNIATTGPISFVCGTNTDPTSGGGLLLIEEDFCNPWPVYGVTVHIEWDWTITALPPGGRAYCTVAFFPQLDDTGLQNLFLFDTDITGNAPGSGVIDSTPGVINSGGARILIQIPLVIVGVGTGVTFNITKLTIRPLLPPDTSNQPCTEVSSWTNPANDYWAVAELVTGGTGTVTGTMVDATLETDEPSLIVSTTIVRSVWYKWVAPANGSITFTTQGSTPFVTLLAAYTGASVAALVQIAADEGSHPPPPIWSEITFVAVSGTTYYLQVSTTGTVGAVTLNWHP